MVALDHRHPHHSASDRWHSVLCLPSLSFSMIKFDPAELNTAVRGLVAMVLLFDIYTIYQQVQIYRIRRQLAEREELFRLISENAADMIALVDA